MSEYDRARSLMRERQQLQDARKQSNLNAAMQRAALSKAMDSMRFSRSVGSLSVGELMAKSRPMTAG
jgi:hypothetical protein